MNINFPSLPPEVNTPGMYALLILLLGGLAIWRTIVLRNSTKATADAVRALVKQLKDITEAIKGPRGEK